MSVLQRQCACASALGWSGARQLSWCFLQSVPLHSAPCYECPGGAIFCVCWLFLSLRLSWSKTIFFCLFHSIHNPLVSYSTPPTYATGLRGHCLATVYCFLDKCLDLLSEGFVIYAAGGYLPVDPTLSRFISFLAPGVLASECWLTPWSQRFPLPPPSIFFFILVFFSILYYFTSHMFCC